MPIRTVHSILIFRAETCLFSLADMSIVGQQGLVVVKQDIPTAKPTHGTCMCHFKYDRRSFLAAAGGTFAAAALTRATKAEPKLSGRGLVVGYPQAAEAGNAVLADGGN